jgi:hypothetical protein
MTIAGIACSGNRVEGKCMLQYERLKEEERPQRLTVAHAIDALESVGFAADDTAEIRIGGLRLPSGEVTGLISAFFSSLIHDKTFIVSLATSGNFQAKHQASSEFAQFDIFELDKALFSGAGDVVLANGTKLRAVEVLPTQLPYDFSDLERRIVQFTISMMDATDRCYRYFGNGLPLKYQKIAPYLRALDCETFNERGNRPKLKIPPLKVILGNFLDANPDVESLSRQKISDALSKIGLHQPTRRPKAA